MTTAKLPTDPAEFMRFHLLLTKHRPEYEPHYIKVKRGDSVVLDEDGELKSTRKAATGKHTKITAENAVSRLKRGTNVGIAGRCDGDLVIIDVDDLEIIKPSELKPTLKAMSRSRDGYHFFFMLPIRPTNA